jgi:hypothetical protein
VVDERAAVCGRSRSRIHTTVRSRHFGAPKTSHLGRARLQERAEQLVRHWGIRTVIGLDRRQRRKAVAQGWGHGAGGVGGQEVAGREADAGDGRVQEVAGVGGDAPADGCFFARGRLVRVERRCGDARHLWLRGAILPLLLMGCSGLLGCRCIADEIG